VIIIGFVVIVFTLLAIEGQVRKGNKQKEEIIRLLKEK